jgi:hypothetical protein
MHEHNAGRRTAFAKSPFLHDSIKQLKSLDIVIAEILALGTDFLA